MRDRKIDFSIYKKNQNIIYLDYAATTFMPDQVIDCWVEYQKTVGMGCNRGDGLLSEIAHQEYNMAKAKILTFFDASKDYDLVLGKNATECLNLLAYSLRKIVFPGDIILMGPYEHHSNILPWEDIAKKTGACLVQLPLAEAGNINYNFIDSIDKNRIKVVSMSAVSNVNCHVVDMNWFKNLIAECKAFSILDVSQAVGHRKLFFDEIGADAYVMSAHKMYGPKNIGAAVVKKEKLEFMEPLILGGGMVWNSLGGNPKWHMGARKFEAGTFDVGLVKAWAEACKYLSDIGMEKVSQSDQRIWEYAKNRLKKDHFVIIPGGDLCSSIISFCVNKLHPHDVARVAAKHNFEIRTGHMCAQGALNNLGFPSICRLSWGIGSDVEEVKSFIDLLEEEIG